MTENGGNEDCGRVDWLVLSVFAFFAAAFFFCVVASVVWHWHQSVTKPGIAVSVIGMIAAILWAHFRGEDE